MRHIGHMSRIHFDRLGIGTLGHHAPSGLGLACGTCDLVGKRVSGDRHLRYSHVVGLGWGNIRREVGREMLLFYPPVAVAIRLERLGGLRQGLFDRSTTLTLVK